jgi:hypothetical protein
MGKLLKSAGWQGNLSIEQEEIEVMMSTVDKDGGSVGTTSFEGVYAYKDDSNTEDPASMTVDLSYDSMAGVLRVYIDLEANRSFYTAGSDFTIIGNTFVIDGETVNAILFSFSIENRS